MSRGIVINTQAPCVEVGDVIHLKEDEPVPCDLVVLSTSHDHGQCYVQTTNLDGETNLKTKHAASVTKGLKSEREISEFVGYVECEVPNPKLDAFVGRLIRLKAVAGRFKVKSLEHLRSTM